MDNPAPSIHEKLWPRKSLFSQRLTRPRRTDFDDLYLVMILFVFIIMYLFIIYGLMDVLHV